MESERAMAERKLRIYCETSFWSYLNGRPTRGHASTKVRDEANGIRCARLPYFAPNAVKGFAGYVRLVKLRWTGTVFEVE